VRGAIEAGGTKFVCAVGRDRLDVVAETRIPTTSPEATLAAVARFFATAEARFGAVESFGIATFGPVDLDARSTTWGRILDTPKAGWSGADLVGPFRRRFGRPVALETDVNAAALAEHRWGAGQGVHSLAYVTVGTGIGGGAVVGGRTLAGFLHPEMGHLRVRRDARDLEFAGTCPFHGDCLEGLACGPAIRARWGATLDELAPGHEAYSIVGHYLGQLAATLALVLSTERIVFGGGVGANGALLAEIRAATSRVLNGYLPLERAARSLDEYVVAPGLGDRSGIDGAFLLAAGVAGD
jgi:fructokinase